MPAAAHLPRLLAALIVFSALALCACAPVSAPAAGPTAEPGPPQVMVTLPATFTPPPDQDHPPAAPFHGPLSVVVLHPADGETVATSPVEISGTADPGTVLTVADEILLVGRDGAFKTLVALEPGPNLIEITASDAQEDQDFAYLTVLFEPDQ